MQDIPALHYSHRGSIRALAEHTAASIESVPGTQADLCPRTPCFSHR